MTTLCVVLRFLIPIFSTPRQNLYLWGKIQLPPLLFLFSRISSEFFAHFMFYRFRWPWTFLQTPWYRLDSIKHEGFLSCKYNGTLISTLLFSLVHRTSPGIPQGRKCLAWQDAGISWSQMVLQSSSTKTCAWDPYRLTAVNLVGKNVKFYRCSKKEVWKSLEKTSWRK